MKLSKFYHQIELENEIYAIFNSLIMDIIYVQKEKLNKILSFDVDDTDIEDLKKAGIYIKKDSQDKEALNIVKNRYDKVCGKVQIMYLILSSACNLACKYCFIENCTFNNKKEVNMDEETVKNALTKYTNYLKENKIKEGSIIFYGGEPLVNWNAIVFALEYAEKLKSPIKFSMVTNATLLEIEKIKYLSQHNVEV